MKNSINSLTIGTVITLSTFCFSYAASTSKFIGLSHVLYWQGWWLQTFIPCLNIGTAENPFCEGTPLNLVVFFLGIPFGIVLYSLLAFGVISIWNRRAA
jgi:hypothetical protein